MVVRTPAATRARRAFSAAEFAALESAGIFDGFPTAVWHAEDVYRADDDTPYLFSVEQYHRMIDAALLHEDERVELIEGEVLHAMPIGNPHSRTVTRITKLFNRRVGDDIDASPQNPIRLSTSEPLPDVVLLWLTADQSRTPIPGDVALLIEVADTSLSDDLGWKCDMYAAEGIGEYWVVDLTTDVVHVHRGPQSDGTWTTVTVHGRGDTLTVATLSGVAVAVDELLP